jgi:hypothetical protein
LTGFTREGFESPEHASLAWRTETFYITLLIVLYVVELFKQDFSLDRNLTILSRQNLLPIFTYFGIIVFESLLYFIPAKTDILRK